MTHFLPTIEFEITEDRIKQYADVSRDFNPIHLSKQAANAAGLPDKVAHGMMSMAISAKVMSIMLENGWVLSSFRMKFSAPLFVGDTLTAETSRLKSDLDKKELLHITGKNQHHHTVIHGEIELFRK